MIKCKVCKFWDKSADDKLEDGLCRILPPVANSALGRGLWPYTQETDSCGAGKPK